MPRPDRVKTCSEPTTPQQESQTADWGAGREEGGIDRVREKFKVGDIWGIRIKEKE